MENCCQFQYKNIPSLKMGDNMFNWKKHGPQHHKAPKIVKKAYSTWYNQKRRCNIEFAKGYEHYGAKGITVDYSQDQFIEWFLKNTKSKKQSELAVGRINHSKNYSFDNIEITTKSENSKERIERLGTPLKKIPVEMYDRVTGKKIKTFKSIKDASLETGIRVGTIYRWIQRVPKLTKHNKHKVLFRRVNAI